MSNIDKLGILNAQIKELQEKAAKLRHGIIELGVGQHSGDMYDANVIESTSVRDDSVLREITDAAADAARAALSVQFITAHTYPVVTTTVKLVGKSSRVRKAA